MKTNPVSVQKESRYRRAGLVVLLAVNLLLGVLTFRDYGLSWDEPLFYDYAGALGYAYSPREWLSGDFDLNNAYGASGDDHKTRGPAYLLLARTPVHLLQATGLDSASAWHLVNFLFFQLGVYFLYRLSARWVKPSAALAASALFAWQPLLWGHAFINPKDPPFLAFFLASVCLGFEMVDRWSDEAIHSRQRFSSTILPAVILGITTSIRVLGPLADLLVIAYALWRFGRRFTGFIPALAFYGIVAMVSMLASWPFLWEDPVARFTEVFRFMSDNPTRLSVLFGGEVYRADELPRRYLPFMLATTLTEPVWPLFLAGILLGYSRLLGKARKLRAALREAASADGWKSLRSSLDLETPGNQIASLSLVLLWFVILVAYVLIRKPSMYDGLRHFLFILPPVFVAAGFAFEFLIERLSFPSVLSVWLRAGLILILALAGLPGIVQLHPYEYTYYNSFAGGTGRAFRQYETDYWLTCYKDAVEQLNQSLDQPASLYVHREAYVAAYYADEDLQVHELRGALDEVKSGDYVLVNTRTNEDRRIFKDAPPVIEVSREQALFCVIKGMP
ncbi:MAG TPA: hypothetical protein VI524_08045 [Anaerolineales bacterium]|nr:hypothetical protein [Anaerolineales bacterium]